MKFKFPYEVLMEHRKRTEEIARRDFFEVKNKLDMEMDTEKQMHERVKIAWEIRFEMQTKGTGAALGMCTEIEEFLNGQKVRIARQQEVISNLSTIVEQKRELLVAAAKEVKILEKLREKRMAEFKKLQRKKDIKATDEIVVTRHAFRERA